MEAEELFDAWERAWSGRDPHGFESVCARAVHYEDPLTPEPLVGVRALADHAQRLWEAMPDARVNRTGERLSDGTFALPQALQVKVGTAAFAPVGASTPLTSWSAPVGKDVVAVDFKQSIAETDGLRSGTYGKTLVFTLSTTTP